MTIKIDLLREELTAAGIDYYLAVLEAGQLIVRFLDGDLKRDPTSQEQAAIDAVVAAHDPQLLTQAEQLREAIKTIAQSAVGETLDNLTQAQLKALVAILLWKAGAVESNLTIRPLGQWVRNDPD